MMSVIRMNGSVTEGLVPAVASAKEPFAFSLCWSHSVDHLKQDAPYPVVTGVQMRKVRLKEVEGQV